MVSDLTFDWYQELSAQTAVYPEHGTGTYGELAYLALGMGEVGELQNKVKKIHRDGVRDDEAMAAEIGDVLWYLARFAAAIDMSLGDIASANLKKLQDRKARGVIQGSGDDR